MIEWLKQQVYQQDVLFLQLMDKTQEAVKKIQDEYPDLEMNIRVRFSKYDWINHNVSIEFFKIKNELDEYSQINLEWEKENIVFKYDCYELPETFVPENLLFMFKILQKENVLTNYWFSVLEITCADRRQFSFNSKRYQAEVFREIKPKLISTPQNVIVLKPYVILK